MKIFEYVGNYMCSKNEKLYLIYTQEQDTAFAPQFKLTPEQLQTKLDNCKQNGEEYIIKGNK